MSAVKCRFMLVMTVCALTALVSAQITFSRDWAGGKRTGPQVGVDCAQFTRLCRHFVHELKQAMTAELSAKHRKKEQDLSFLYDDE